MPPIDHDKRKRTLRPSLDDIFEGLDEFGLLDVQAKRSSVSAPLEVSKFENINEFIDQHGRPPSNEGDLAEKLLARSLKGYLENHDFRVNLKSYDRHGLLAEVNNIKGIDDTSCPVLVEETIIEQPKKAMMADKTSLAEEVTSLDDIFASAEFADIDLGDSSLFDPVHIQFDSNREAPDEIAQRRTCEDFYQFENIFNGIHDGLRAERIKTARFTQATKINEGDSFILKGVVCLIDSIGEYRTNNEGRYDPRLRVIFENGTESNLLLHSLSKRLYEDESGRRIVRDAESVEDAFNNISHKDKRAGQIYFVTTKSEKTELKGIPNLVKIGYTELTVEERTKNAERDTAFLEGPIRILASMECYNLNPHKFESLIHGFLHAQRLKVTLVGKDGKAYHPKEWFSVPLDTAREVVRRIIDGSITQYRMNNTTGRLIKKNE